MKFYQKMIMLYTFLAMVSLLCYFILLKVDFLICFFGTIIMARLELMTE